jgi:N-acetylmuramoyl-L-alanine amidase
MWQGFGLRIALAGLILAVPCLDVTPAHAEAAAVIGTRIGAQPGQTRFVLDLTAPAKFDVFLAAEPYRAVIDLPNVEWRVAAATDGRGLISAVRHGPIKPGTSRVVLDLAEPAVIAKSFTLPPHGDAAHRVVIDLRPASRDEFLAAARGAVGRPSGSHPPMQPPSAMRRGPLKHLVAIDAGHGGVDPGAVGIDGSFEKDITLAAALAVREALIATKRYDVVMTRDTDAFIALRDRFKAAQAVGAEAFISLHADILADRSVRGATVYTLSENASDTEAAALAARENKADMLAGVDLTDHSPQVAQILIELTQRVTMNASAVLAHEMVEELKSVIPLMHNTHRYAGFAVLKSPEIPSILIEMGYLSNRLDERQLKEPRFRAKLAAAIVRAFDRYFASQQALKRP